MRKAIGKLVAIETASPPMMIVTFPFLKRGFLLFWRKEDREWPASFGAPHFTWRNRYVFRIGRLICQNDAQCDFVFTLPAELSRSDSRKLRREMAARGYRHLGLSRQKMIAG